MRFFTHRQSIAVSLFLIWTTLACNPPRPKPQIIEEQQAIEEINISCDDFLALWDQKPENLKFTGCERVGEAQVHLVATYVVKGANAANVESVLIEAFGMAPLRFICCGWENSISPEAQAEGRLPETRIGRYTDDSGNQFSIEMGSEETLLTKRENWSEIPSFHVLVDVGISGT